MSKLPTVHKPGLRVWRAILLELLRREREREAPPSVAALARAAGKSRPRIRDQLASLEQLGFVDWDSQLGHHGSDIRLTELGRLVARLVAVDFN